MFFSACDNSLLLFNSVVDTNLKAKIPLADLSINTPQNSPQKMLMQTMKPIPQKFLQKLLDEISPYTYRIKGFCQLKSTSGDIANYYISTVKSRVKIEKWDKQIKKSELIFILPPNPAIEQILEEAWNSLEKI